MAYHNFTLGSARRAFGLETVWKRGMFADIAPIEPSALLTTALERNLPYTHAIGNEKAESEMVVAPVLVECCVYFESRVSLFSGIYFDVDAKNELMGMCSFLVSLSPQCFELESPVILPVEAKGNRLTNGLGKCAAEMVAAQRFNAEAGNDIPCIYGAVTSGTEWFFLKLEGQTLSIDLTVYPIAQCDKILGILASMVSQAA